MTRIRTDWQAVRGLLRVRSLLLLMAQGFFGVFAWNVLIFWFFRYLEKECGYTSGQAMTTMLVAIAALSIGYLLGGNLGLDVLKQGGVVAIFPEGGIWDAGRMRAPTGVAWLSYRANAPVLPIGFGGTTGALGAALRLKRPRLTMQVGQLMPAARLPGGKSRKAYFGAFATRVVEAIRALLPTDDPARQVSAIDERFELRVAVEAPDGSPETHPDDLGIQHATALAKLLHRPAILKIFTSNLNLPTRPLQKLEREPDPAEIVIRIIVPPGDRELTSRRHQFVTVRWPGYRHQRRNVGFGRGYGCSKGVHAGFRITSLDGKGMGRGREQTG